MSFGNDTTYIQLLTLSLTSIKTHFLTSAVTGTQTRSPDTQSLTQQCNLVHYGLCESDAYMM